MNQHTSFGSPVEELGRLRASWWAVDEISEMLVRVHHAPLRAAIPSLRSRLAALSAEYGGAEPAFVEAAAVFADASEALLSHFAKEENILFPAFCALARAWRSGESAPPLPFPSLRHPIDVMEAEHTKVDRGLARLREITNGFVAPPGACRKWRSCFRDLARFDRDLQMHAAIETDVLFPHALELERALL